MLDAVKRWFSTTPAVAPVAGGWEAIAAWAESRGYSFRGVRESDGFVVDGRLGSSAWRLEWGPSQRPYVIGPELRLRAEMGLGNEIQVLLLDRPLQEQMEKAVFEQYVEGVQTRIDTQTPPEMRWLVMFPKLSGAEMGSLRERFVGIASHKAYVAQWLQGALAGELASAPHGPGHPLVLMISRGRLVLRTALAEPGVADLEAWLQRFETAMQEAGRATTLAPDDGAPSTQASVWSASSLAGEEAAKS